MPLYRSEGFHNLKKKIANKLFITIELCFLIEKKLH